MQKSAQSGFLWGTPSTKFKAETIVTISDSYLQLTYVGSKIPSAFSSKYLCRVSLYKNLTHFAKAAKLYKHHFIQGEAVNTNSVAIFF